MRSPRPAISFFVVESKENRLQAIGRSWALEPSLAERVRELGVLRNALVHNHVWEVVLRRTAGGWNRPGELQRAEVKHGDTARDAYVAASVDEGTQRTKVLRLHLVPTEVRRWDVARLLPVVVEAVDALNGYDVPNMRSPADYQIRVGAELVGLRCAADLLG